MESGKPKTDLKELQQIPEVSTISNPMLHWHQTWFDTPGSIARVTLNRCAEGLGRSDAAV